MRTRGALKRSRGRKEDEEFLSLNTNRRKKHPVRKRTVWKKDLVYSGPKSLSLYNTHKRLTPDAVDDFVELSIDVAWMSTAEIRPIYPKNPPFLPPQVRSLEGRKTLVLDLDETLVHSVTELVTEEHYDATFEVKHMGAMKTIGVKKRPFVNAFLSWCATHFEVVTFTSGIKPYADEVLKLLDPEGELVKYHLHREHCTICNSETHFKNLDYLRRDLSQTLIVDNSPMSFAYHIENGVPIQSFTGKEEEKNDTELLKLKNFLEEVMKANDVRPLIETKFKVREFLGYISTRLTTSSDA